MTDGPAYVHRIPVRYGEVDMQGVVFNAHYLAYCDDTADTWWRAVLGQFEDSGWEPMVVKAVVEWQGSAGIGDTLDIAAGVARWGTTSFDVSFRGGVRDRAIFTATVTYVGVDPADKTPKPPPPTFRTALGG